MRPGRTTYASGVSSSGQVLLSVKTYGATGNGVADDTAAFQAAHDAAPDDGAVIYIPAGEYKISIDEGDTTHKIAFTITKQNITLLGDGPGLSIIKLADDQGDYRAMVADNTNTGTTDISGLTIEGLTFDQNSANNEITDVEPTDPLFQGFARYVIRFNTGSGLIVENCHFINTDNVNTIAANGTTASDISIENNIFSNVGADSPEHDHSSIYVHAARMHIADNAFVAGGISARTAIETHGDEQSVHNNAVKDFFRLANITGVAVSSKGAIVQGNMGLGLGSGIVIWSNLYAGNNSGFGIEDVLITGNTIEIDMDAHEDTLAFKTGVSLDPGSTLPVRNVVIRDNVIKYKTFTTVPTALDAQSAGIQWYRSSALSGSDTNLVIEDNIVQSPPASGMYLSPNSTATKRLNVQRNLITNVGEGDSPNFASTYKGGILIIGAYEDTKVSNNQMVDDRGTHIMSSGVYAALVTSTVGCEAVGNMFRLADGAAVSAFVSAAGMSWTLAHATTGLYTINRYYTAPSAARTTTAVVDGTAYAHPFWVGQTTSFDRIGCEVTTAAASSTVRLGIYADTGRGSPGAKILDAGTGVDSSSTGAKEQTIATTLQPGLYWLTVVPQGGAPTLRAHNGTLYPVGAGSLAGATGAGGIFSGLITAAAAVTGALPAAFPAIANFQAFSPLVALRAAA